MLSHGHQGFPSRVRSREGLFFIFLGSNPRLQKTGKLNAKRRINGSRLWGFRSLFLYWPAGADLMVLVLAFSLGACFWKKYHQVQRQSVHLSTLYWQPYHASVALFHSRSQPKPFYLSFVDHLFPYVLISRFVCLDQSLS